MANAQRETGGLLVVARCAPLQTATERLATSLLRAAWIVLLFLPLFVAAFSLDVVHFGVPLLLLFCVLAYFIDAFRFRWRMTLRVFHDRIDLSGRVIPFCRLHHAELVGAHLRLVHTRNTGIAPTVVELSLNFLHAEDIFDGLADAIAEAGAGSGHCTSLCEQGEMQCTRDWSFAEILPRQQATDSAELEFQAGKLVFQIRTGHGSPLRGTVALAMRLYLPAGPDDNLAGEAPVLVFDGRRVTTGLGMVLAVVVSSTPAVRRLEFTNRSSLALDRPGERVTWNGDPMGCIDASPGRRTFRAAGPWPEGPVLVALLVSAFSSRVWSTESG